MKIKKLDHLSQIYNKYDAFLIDLWGVMHNGIRLNASAMNVVQELEKQGKRIVFLSNAPRSSRKVIEFLKKLKMDEKFLKNVFTSGEAAKKYLASELDKQKFFHIGPPRDYDLFENVKKNNVLNIDDADYFLCTGLFDNYDKNLDYYKIITALLDL